MSINTHLVQIFQRPRQGSAFIAQHIATGYRHSIIAKGGFDTASWSLQLNTSGAEIAFSQYIGCVVRVYVDNPNEPIWEGFINRVTWRVGGLVLTRSFDAMMNRVTVTFYNADSAATNKTEQTSVVDNAQSQAIFGIKEGSLDAGVHHSNANKTHKEIMRDTRRSVASWPQISVATADGGDGIIEFEAKGLQYFAWDWQNYKNTDTTLDNASFLFGNVTCNAPSPYLPANAPYVYDVSAAIGIKISANASFQMSRKSESGGTYLQFLQSIVEAGDGTNEWVFGIETPDVNTGKRQVYYRRANTAIQYNASALADSGRLRDLSGRIIPGYLVRPDAGVRINDILTGWDGLGDDPRTGYLERIEYDGESGSVSWSTGDGTDLEDAMQRTQRIKPYAANNPFAAPPRNNL